MRGAALVFTGADGSVARRSGLEMTMRQAVLVLALLCPFSAAWAASDKDPNLDVAKTCTEAQKAQDGIPDKYAKCMADEDQAKATLATAWPAARASRRDTCE